MSDPTFYLAGCIILDDTKRVLLLHRHTDRRTQWELPGGKVQPGEDARAAVAHIVQDELGVDVHVRHQLGDKHTDEEGHIVHYSWFLTQIAGQPHINDPEVHNEMRYFSIDELKKLNHELSPSGRSFLEFVTRGDIRL
jgi:8-oxo-dGTP diphosphatase